MEVGPNFVCGNSQLISRFSGWHTVIMFEVLRFLNQRILFQAGHFRVRPKKLKYSPSDSVCLRYLWGGGKVNRDIDWVILWVEIAKYLLAEAIWWKKSANKRASPTFLFFWC